MPALATIAFGTPFLPHLARHLRARFPDPLALAKVLVLLPSARARDRLVEAFLAEAQGRALLLPRMAAIAQVDEDEALGRFLEESPATVEPLPPITPIARRLALARLLLPLAGNDPAVADRLARDLARVLDELHAHGADPAQLPHHALPELAAHRARGLAVLKVILEHWPALLEERGLSDPILRRERLLSELEARWAVRPPGHPVVAAGFSTAPPAVARLLARIARLADGEVILPGLPPDMDAAEWAAIGATPTHPLHGLSQLLAAMGAAPEDARALGPPADARARSVLAAFRPARLPPAPRQPPPAGVRLLELPGPEAEGLAIALALRRVLETPGRTGALVTRSRALAERVRLQLGRWGIEVDDSAGEPLATTPPGVFILALVEAAARRFAPVALLAALQHPLAGQGAPGGRAAWLAGVRALDRALRGPTPPPGLAGIARRLARDPADRRAERFWQERVAPALGPLEASFARPPTLAAATRELVQVAEALAGPALWAGPAGRALGTLVAELQASADAQGLTTAPDAAAALFRNLMADVPVRPPWRRHPRLMILGPLEARLAQADVLVLGGLNEGQWPAEPVPDPWLAPAVRRALGLPPAERRVGLEAHDLLQALAAPELLLTRARRDQGALTVPSRFLLRLKAAFGPLPGDPELEAALGLDGQGPGQPMPPPDPRPPASVRPRRIRVTEVDMLAADPFSFYARHLLGLAPLDPLEQPPDGAVRGVAVHRILERLSRDPGQDPAGLIARELDRLAADPAALALWRPRVARMVDWVRRELQREDAQGWRPAAFEVSLEGEWHGVRIEGRADRIDRHASGALRIVDYKTGRLPTRRQFEDGQARQLPLLRWLVERGGGPAGIAGGTVHRLEYWKLSGGRFPGERHGGDWTVERTAVEEALAGLLARYLLGDAPFRPKLAPVYATAYRTYDHLARVEEWL